MLQSRALEEMPLTKSIKSSHEDQNRKLNYLKRHPITLRFGDSSLEGLFLQEVAKSRLPVFIAIAAFDATLFAFRKIFKAILWADVGAGSVGISSTWWTVLGQGFNLVVLHALIATIHFFSHSSASAASKGELLLAALISCILCILVTSPLASAQWVIIAFFLICTSTLLRLRWYIGSIAFSVPVALATAVSATLRSRGNLPLLVPALKSLEPLSPNSIIHLSIAWAVGTLMGYLSDESRRTAFANHRRAVVAVKTELEQMEARLAAEQNLSAVQALAQAKSLLVERERAANEAKSEFISMLCHEIRTPLSGCLASAEMLLECDLSVSCQSSVSCPPLCTTEELSRDMFVW